MSKWQQGEKDSFLEPVEELVNSLGCSLHLQSDVNCYDWYKWKDTNTSSQALNYWKQLWLVAVPISSQAEVYCITYVSENSVGVNSSKGTSCRFWLTAWCLIRTPFTWIPKKSWNICPVRDAYVSPLQTSKPPSLSIGDREDFSICFVQDFVVLIVLKSLEFPQYLKYKLWGEITPFGLLFPHCHPSQICGAVELLLCI